MLRAVSPRVGSQVFATEGGNRVTAIRSSDAQNVDPQTGTPVAAAAGGEPIVNRWPVLARLPDVTAQRHATSQMPAPSQQQTRPEEVSPLSRNAQQSAEPKPEPKLTPAPTDYRFDPPESFGPHISTDQVAAASSTATTGSPTTIRTHRPGTSRSAARHVRPARSRPTILPSSNLFNIRSRGSTRKLATAVQFLMLFALFTAAGSSLLLMQTTDRWTSADPTEAPPAVDQATAKPVTAEPSATRVPLDWDLPEPPSASRPHVPSPSVEESVRDATDDTSSQALEDLVVPPYPTTAAPPMILPEDVGQQSLPQVRTIDGPPAVARLPGYVREVPLHQAYDDRNESSLH